IPDIIDACPDRPGVSNKDPKQHGCPPDSDGDGIYDPDDACPTVPGSATGDPRTNGCRDSDGDGIFDPLDACPQVPGIKSDDPTKNGCPAARIENKQIQITEQIKFETDKAVIKAESSPILQAVADVLK